MTTAVVPRIETLSETKLIGKRITMNLTDNKTGELWRSFMPGRKEIANSLTTDLFSMRVYDASYNFKDFDLSATFDKWAAVEVADFNNIPDGMEPFTIPGGLYAVFHYKGLNTDTSIFRYIFGTWIPNSDYVLDNRPHFEILGDKYRNNDPESEEDIWVPVKPKV